MKIILFVSIALALIMVSIKELPKKKTIVDFMKKLGLPFVVMLLSFIIGTYLFFTPISGLFLAILGWVLTTELIKYLDAAKSRHARTQIKDFVTHAASLYASGNTSPEVIKRTSAYMKEPLATDIRKMLAVRQFKGSTFPVMFNELADKYKVPEIGAVARIIEAGEITGGSSAIANGLERLGDAIGRRDEMLAERKEATLEPVLAAGLTIAILVATAIIDITVLRHVFVENGMARLAMGLGIGVISGLAIALVRLFKNEDLGA